LSQQPFVLQQPMSRTMEILLVDSIRRVKRLGTKPTSNVHLRCQFHQHCMSNFIVILSQRCANVCLFPICMSDIKQAVLLNKMPDQTYNLQY